MLIMLSMCIYAFFGPQMTNLQCLANRRQNNTNKEFAISAVPCLTDRANIYVCAFCVPQCPLSFCCESVAWLTRGERDWNGWSVLSRKFRTGQDLATLPAFAHHRRHICAKSTLLPEPPLLLPLPLWVIYATWRSRPRSSNMLELLVILRGGGGRPI